MRKTHSAVKFIVRHTCLTTPYLTEVAVKTGNNSVISAIHQHIAYVERHGNCKMASLSDVKLKAPQFFRCVVEQERNDHLVMMHTSIARGDVWCKN